MAWFGSFLMGKSGSCIHGKITDKVISKKRWFHSVLSRKSGAMKTEKGCRWRNPGWQWASWKRGQQIAMVVWDQRAPLLASGVGFHFASLLGLHFPEGLGVLCHLIPSSEQHWAFYKLNKSNLWLLSVSCWGQKDSTSPQIGQAEGGYYQAEPTKRTASTPTLWITQNPTKHDFHSD